ncbi:hypothetical protein [Catellatospora vulcania]|uniref:hypothetical protein n=1 Tax=Catellatospora vulcania TaxID=1460450 RepID=UPI0012D4756E|nr:hypothetical protein [Catellatospora vulcania]
MRTTSLRDDHPRGGDAGRVPEFPAPPGDSGGRTGARTSPVGPVHLCGTWLAIHTTDQAAVLAALDLSGPVPVTMRQGEAAWNRDHHSWGLARDDHRSHGRVYVAPAIDGWTLVFGTLPETAHIDPADRSTWARRVQTLCARLSTRFGATHLYGMSCGDAWTMWCLAEAGAVRRYYEAGSGERLGGPHRAEDGYRLPDEDDELPADAYDGIDPADVDAVMARRAELFERHALPEVCYATDIAASTSVDPSVFGPDTPVSGQALLALTACGREHGVVPDPPGR